MPVCLKCGKEIDPGRNFCEDCGSTNERETFETLTDLQSKYVRRKPRNLLWTVVLMVVLFGIALGVGYGLLSMIPNNKKIKTETQAHLCHRNLVNIQAAIDKYYKNGNSYPPPGRLNSQGPLVVDQYIKTVPTCPTTGHQYIIKNLGATDPRHPEKITVRVYCDSGLKGHSL